MMTKKATVLYVLRLALTLLLICGAVAAALAGVNSITAPIIRTAKNQKSQAAIEAVLPGGGQATIFTDDTGLVRAVYESEIGYAVKVVPTGFNGPIEMMVGVDKEGNVLAVSIISQTETAGLGAVAAADVGAGKTFREQFVGVSGSIAVSKDGGSIDAITGATITSRAICDGINAALACVARQS